MRAAITDFIGTFLLLLALLLGSFTLNVLVHELGHYAVASSFDLDPSMHFLDPMEGITAFSVATQPVAYVEFIHTQNPWFLISVALAGVMLNAILGLIFTLLYVQYGRNYFHRTIYMALVLPCVLSIFINLNIFNGHSDGALVWETLKNFFH